MSLRVTYQGIEGAYSSVAIGAYLGGLKIDYEAIGVPTFRQVATAVIAEKADLGLVPVDNAISGTMRDGYDLLAEYGLLPLVELDWRMDHRLLGVPGAELSGIREVMAHPLVLAECGRFLATLAGARIIPAVDTGVAARDLARSGDVTHAAIAPAEAAELYGLVELARSIADHPENYTRFLLFTAPPCSERVNSELLGRLDISVPGGCKTSLLLSTRHQQGALAECLGILATAGINLAKLESRPKLGKPWEYLFYVDLEGNASEPRVSQALSELSAKALSLQVIGSYRVGVGRSESQGVAEPAPPPAQVDSPAEAPPLPASAKNYPKAARPRRPQGTRIPLGSATVLGGDEFVVIAGPCSIESKQQIMETARKVVGLGARMLRGGAFKPRTNPYSFQGLGWEGVALLAEAGRTTGVPVVSEVMSVEQVERMAREVDVLQVGARNMQNFDLLRAVGKTDRPVLLKRGLSASLDELLAAAEYILAEGNPHVILCERGIRTFETATRNTLDLSSIPVLLERSHLPVIVDPSHGVGVRRWIRPLCRAAKTVGAHGLMVEVHPNPVEAQSDAEQALTFQDFAEVMWDLAELPNVRRSG
jgi:3-deoxy-7-phosphoheptulonate synthase